MRSRRSWLTMLVISAVAAMSACGSSMTSSSSNNLSHGTMVLMGTDFPTLSNVVSFQAPISGITVSGNGTGNVAVMNAPATIDFATLVGLQTLIDVQPVTAGNYTSATITFGANPTLSILDTTVSPPKITTLNAHFSAMSVTVNFPNEETEDVTPSKVLGMILDFRLDKSIPVDASGNIVVSGGTVTVTPVIRIRLLNADRDRFEVDELRGGVVSVGGSGTFVIQTSRGQQITVSTDSNTQFEPSGQSFSTLSANDIVEIEEGDLDPSTLMVKAKEVEVFPDKFVVSGLVTFANPAAKSGSTICSETVSLLVRDALPGGISSSFPANQIASISLTGSEKFFIHHQDFLSAFNQLSFNSCSLVPGQALTIGGALSGGSTLTAADVGLGTEGFAGTAATGLAGNATFAFNAQGLAGVLLPGPVTVQVLQLTDFDTELENLTDFTNITAGTQLHLSGLVLFNTSANTANVLALRLVQPED
ncbi:MAG TPA: hypothetical protein VGS20_14630 [Candidatus Acidoferrales bacterium]|nr:hypothetical protein [Candidatus Acidoferrales bacterium]